MMRLAQPSNNHCLSLLLARRLVPLVTLTFKAMTLSKASRGKPSMASAQFVPLLFTARAASRPPPVISDRLMDWLIHQMRITCACPSSFPGSTLAMAWSSRFCPSSEAKSAVRPWQKAACMRGVCG